MEHRIPTSEDLEKLVAVAKILVGSGLYRNKCDTISQAVSLMLLGMDYGLSPLSALGQINIISGKPSLSAGAQAALAKRGGRYTWRVDRIDDSVCELVFLQASGDEWVELGPAAFSFEEAKEAGIASTMTWRKYRQDMLFARALSRGCRRYCPDQFGGTVYTEGELVESPRPLRGDLTEVVLVQELPSSDSVGSTKTYVGPTGQQVLQESVPVDPDPETYTFNASVAAAYASNVGAYKTLSEARQAVRPIEHGDLPDLEKRRRWLELCSAREGRYSSVSP